MRTIDADAFDATMYEAWKNNEVTNEEWVHFREMIKDEPTIEPQRMRGRWNELKPQAAGYWQCSACGFPSEAFAAAQLYKFCPNCGADMRGGQNEDC